MGSIWELYRALNALMSFHNGGCGPADSPFALVTSITNRWDEQGHCHTGSIEGIRILSPDIEISTAEVEFVFGARSSKRRCGKHAYIIARREHLVPELQTSPTISSTSSHDELATRAILPSLASFTHCRPVCPASPRAQ